MRDVRRIGVIVLALAWGGLTTAARQAPATPAVILITLDGARAEEMFGGLDAEILASTLKAGQSLEQQPVYRQFSAETPARRREKLMPFFWTTLMRQHGSIAGNRVLGSRVALENTHWFSYPGYAEILVGRAHDKLVSSNDAIRNPHTTVLEHLRQRAGLPREQVAVFASWSVFTAIAEHAEGALTINAGFARWESPAADVKQQSALQFQTMTPWDTVRHDAYTARFALDHLERHRPRVLYVALGETDDWAHDGRYDRVLQAYHQTDEFLKTLWNWLQQQADYRGRTSLLITTDHGRGRTPADWRDHGKAIAGSGETWMAFISPSMQQRGEWGSHSPLSASQSAGTLVEWMGFDAAGFAGSAPAVATTRPPE